VHGGQNTLRVSLNLVRRVYLDVWERKKRKAWLIYMTKLFQGLQSSSSIIRMAEAGMMGWERRLSLLLGEIWPCGFLVGKSEGKGRLEYIGK
jgi:hypothetical protein